MTTPRFLPRLAITATALLALATAATLAAAPALSGAAAIATRQANYKKMGAAMKALGDQLKADAPDKGVMLPAAQTILAMAREQGKLFPAGSGASAGVKTSALPVIWSDRVAFDAQMAKLLVESGKLVAITQAGDVTAIRAQVKATGATCGGCHRQFRADS